MDRLKSFCQQYTHIYLYGAGYYGKVLKEYLDKRNFSMQAFLVSTKGTGQDTYLGLPIYQMDDNHLNFCNVDCGIIVALSEKNQPEVIERLQGCHYLLLDNNELQLYRIKVYCPDEEFFHMFFAKMPMPCLVPKTWENILIVRFDNIGDTLLTGPLFREIKRNWPNVKITLLTVAANRNLMELCPYIDEILVADVTQCQGLLLYEKVKIIEDYTERYLEPRQFDLAIVPRWDIDYGEAAFFAFFSGAKFRIAYSEDVAEDKQVLNHNYDRMFSKVLHGKIVQHDLLQNLNLLEAVGGRVTSSALEMWVTPEDESFAAQKLAEVTLGDPQQVVALAITASMASKMWDYRCYCEVILRLAQDSTSCSFVLLGGPEGRILGAKVREICSEKHIKILDLMGKTTLRQAAAVIKSASLYIGNDTGLTHMAAAFKVKVVEISMVPRDCQERYDYVKRFFPWQTQYIILQPDHALAGCTNLCSQPYAHCINQVRVDDVYDAVQYMLSQGK